MSRNLQAEVTQRIVDLLKAGTVPWKQSWTAKGSGVMPRNAATNRAYSGVNILLLWSRAQHSGYSEPRWMTFHQALEAGAHVRKGEKGETVVFVSHIEKENDKGETYSIPFLKAFTVFNVAQIDGLASAESVETKPEFERINEAEEFIASTGVNLSHGGGRAFYRPSDDSVTLPPFETFASANAYYATAFHELTHWTGADHRMNRGLKAVKRFGDQSYSFEELVAELGSAFCCAEFSFDNNTIDNSAAYIAHWIKFLTSHEDAIVSAASQASKAVEFMRSLAIAEPVAKAA